MTQTPPQHKIITTYRTSNHRLAIETGLYSTSPILTRQWSMPLLLSVENDAHFVLECPLSIGDKFPSLIDVSLYLTEATALSYTREPAS